MNPVGQRILEVLQASPDGHSTALNVFIVLNRDRYNVAKHEFEEACRKLHDRSRITYRPVQSSLIDIPIGTLDLLTKSPALSPLSRDAELTLAIEALSEDSTAESTTIGEIRCQGESETQPNGSDLSGKPSVVPRPDRTSVFALPILLMQVWHRARASSWLAVFAGFSFPF
jgi:hypothetical protein